MNRLWRIIVIVTTALAIVPVGILVLMWVDWQRHCAGGRRVVSGYDTNDCGDIQSVVAIVGLPALVLLIPLATFLAARLYTYIRA